MGKIKLGKKSIVSLLLFLFVVSIVSSVAEAATLPTQKIDLYLLERQVLAAVNVERQKAGVPALKWNDYVAASARGHSIWLASKNVGYHQIMYLNHTDAYGKQHWDRLRKYGVNFTASAENLYGIYSTNPTNSMLVQNAVTAWMNSPGHRTNMLNAAYNQSGIGIALDSTGVNYIFTQVFIRSA